MAPEQQAGSVQFDSAATPAPAAAAPPAPAGTIQFDSQATPVSAPPPPAPTADTSKPVTFDAPAVTADDHSILSRLKNTVEGEDSFLGTHITDPNLGDAFHHALRTLPSKPIINAENYLTPEERKQYPVLDTILQFGSELTTPQNVSIMGLTRGLGIFSRKGLGVLDTLVTAGFSVPMLYDSIKKYPKALDAYNRGDVDEAKRLATQAVLETALGGLGTYHAAKGTASAIEDVRARGVAGKALADVDVDKAVREDLARRQVTSGQRKTVENIGVHATDDVGARRHITEYEQAGKGNDNATDAERRAELKRRQAETIAGPTPTAALDAAQGKTVSLDEQATARQAATVEGQPTPKAPTPKVDVDHIGTRDTLNSVKISENNNDIAHAAFTHDGDTASIGSTWVADAMRGQGYGQRLLTEVAKVAKSQGAKVLTSDPNGDMTEDAVRPWEALMKKGDLPVKRTVIAGKPGFEVDLSKVDAATPPKPATLRVGLTDDPDVRAKVEQAGGVFRGMYKGGGQVEITLPESLADQLPEGRVRPDMKKHISVTVDDAKNATVEQIKDAIDKKFKEYGGVPKPQTMVSPTVQEKQGLFSDEAKANAAAPATGPVQEFSSPAADSARDLAKAVEEGRKRAANRVPTKAERDQMIADQDPNRSISDKLRDAYKYTKARVSERGQELQKRGLIPNLRANYVRGEWGFEDKSNPLRSRLYDSYHEGQQAGLIPENKDYFALSADYMQDTGRMLNDHDFIQDMKRARTNDGRPAMVPGGFIEGQRVSAEGPQSYVIPEQELAKLKSKGQLLPLVRDGHIIQNADGSFTMKTDDFVKTNYYETRPIGPTPIPPHVLEEMKTNGMLDQLEKKGLIYKDANGNYINKEQLYARVPMYAQPHTAEYLNTAVQPTQAAPDPAFFKWYDNVTRNAKSFLLSWSPFHHTTVGLRILEAMGMKGAKDVVFAKPIDWFHPDVETMAALRDGIMLNDVGKYGSNNVSEGLGAAKGTLAEKTYQLFNKALKKAGLPDEVTKYIDPEKIFHDSLFGQDGSIVRAKVAFYKEMKPGLEKAMAEDHPEWSEDKVEEAAGRKAAQFANNKFGGFNYILAGRGLTSQKWLRRVLLAPDFLETTGRSMLDLVDPYGAPLVRNLIKFQMTAGLTAAAINYALHHDDTKKQTPMSVLKASHIIDHPFEVLSGDGKTTYGMRTTLNDFNHMVKAPMNFAYDRVNPAVRALTENLTQRNAYGRKESPMEALKAVPKALMPIWMQSLVGLGNTGLSEPTATDNTLKAFGIGGRPTRTDAEQYALSRVSQHLMGQEALEGPELVKQQLKLRAEDKLRDAYANPDPVKKAQEVQESIAAVANLRNRKIINPEEQKKILTDSKSSRLVSIFNSLTPKDALETWSRATDDEKSQLGVAMHAKYSRWLEKLRHDGMSFNDLDDDGKKMLSQFRAASSEYESIRNAPKPQEAAPAEQTADKTSSAPSVKSAGPGAVIFDAPAAPASPTPPSAPAVYKGSDYTPIIEGAAARYGLDPGLISAMIKQESAGKANATSNKGAHGLMQLLDSTASSYGVKDPNDPAQNIDAGAHYMSDLLKRYDGDEEKALAAYNAGPDAVDKYNGVPPYKETKNYVESIQKNKPLPREYTPTKADIDDFEEWPNNYGPPNVPGMIAPGNIDLSKRPLVRHSNGDSSSLYSMSFGTEDGEVLVPGVSPEGKMLTKKQAFKLYEDTKQHLGIFKSPAAADAYAQYIHEKQGAFQTWKNGGKYNPTVVTYDHWKEPKKE